MTKTEKDIWFCNCDRCGNGIYTGNEMVSVCISRETLLPDESIQPMNVYSARTYCSPCAELMDFESIQINESE